jgi:uncharacterized protein
MPVCPVPRYHAAHADHPLSRMDPRPHDPPPSTPLTEAEISELDELLLAIPEDRDPLDVVMLDGFLAGVLLQPEPVAPGAWLPFVFDKQGRATGIAGDTPPALRMKQLIMRRHDELAACIAAREPFDPILFAPEDAEGEALIGKAAIEALAPWAIGLMDALDVFPALLERYGDDDRAAPALLGILRHLPFDPDAADEEGALLAQQRAALDDEVPLADLDEAIADIVASVMEIADVTRPRRPVTRQAAKVGRNDPCPCGSGRKFKNCHGRGAG